MADPECPRNSRGRRPRPCAVCGGAYADGRCLADPQCPRNFRARRAMFGDGPGLDRAAAASSSAPVAPGDGSAAAHGREHPLRFHLTAADYGHVLHRSRENCEALSHMPLLGAPRHHCPQCDGQRAIARRWFVDEVAAHVRADCSLLDRGEAVMAFECADCFTLVDAPMR